MCEGILIKKTREKDVPCCALVILRVKSTDFLFKKEYVLFFYSMLQMLVQYIKYVLLHIT